MSNLKKLRAWIDLLATSADVISSFGLGLIPKILSSSLGLWIEYTDDDSWKLNNIDIPDAPSNLDHKTLSKSLENLENALLNNPPPGISREHISALFGYEKLWRTYPKLDKEWIPPCYKLPLFAPFIEIFKNHSLEDPMPIKFVKSNKKYIVPPIASGARQGLASMEYENDPKIRTDNITINKDSIVVVEYSQTDYESYLLTNWAIANTKPNISDELRKQLCGVGKLLSMKESLCSNHLGSSAMVTTSDHALVYAVSSRNVVSSPEMSIPAVSGSVDFEPEYEFQGNPLTGTRDILREATEELSISKVGHITGLRLLSVCRNVLRGGKPELIFNINLSCKYSDLTPCSKEHTRLGSLPALVDQKGNSLLGYEENKKTLLGLVHGEKIGDLVISPFLKICLFYYIEYSDLITQNT